MMTEAEIRNRAGEAIDYTFHPGSRADVLVILGHGLTGDKDRPLLVALANGLAEIGWPCLRISYTGNGASEGAFEESCLTKNVGDLQAVLEMVPDDTQAVYAGHSMGGAAGVLAAARDIRISGLVSLAGMTRTAEFVQREFGEVTPGEGCMWEDEDFPLSRKFVDDLTHIGDTLSAAEAVTQPWLLVHGDADDLVPVQDGRDAYEAATCQKEWLEIAGGGHSFDESSYPQIISTINRWLTNHFG
ncbi:MAG: alpha/beta hydrolase [Luteolibacter sp.]